ncbi:TIGR04283 family arsenosugar biosynthesis glycosyltransferase [Ruegeria sp.]|uniref:TIGR04283 family arsenosugar biosynthesis glycosyltransferase n=1 Tax=Ruegeria sp. TaxID=1879320 RepID=UPI002311E3A7|nr:TIGR04283 family arsenosugar biosynthesis glycosyltransferase [Ruegeria sp.]MDA7967068.1 TIGR04283 family arsenosugar biosynthesis glycosyltransferase [Ruegeria sp.]
MSAPISVVIPTLNAGAELPRTLQALMEGLQAGLIRELIISDGGSQDVTLNMADEAGARIETGPPSRGGQLRRGCAEARGEWLLVLHADTELQPGWSAVVSAHLPSGAPAAFRLRFRAKGFGPVWVAGWANLRSRLFGLPYGDQGLLVRRQGYEAAGGYPDQPLMEDVALIRALPRVTLLRAQAVTSAERYTRQGWMRRGGRNLWTLIRYFLGADPERLAQAYRR